MEKSPNQERSFGISVGMVCAFIAIFFLWRGRNAAAKGLWLTAILLIGLGWVKPLLLRIPRKIWDRFSIILGWINSRVFLSAVFFLVLTPVGMILRAGGWDPMKRRKKSSGWVPYPHHHLDPKHYERMY